MPETNFTEKAAYPVIFVIILSVIFVGVLATVYRFSEPSIERQKKQAYEKTILGLCADSLAQASGRTAAEIISAYPKSFEEYIIQLPEGAFARKAFTAKYQDQLIAFVFDVTGKGLWGKLHALIATTSSKTELIGINIYAQEETPGLGARIIETQFTDQFKQKTILDHGKPVSLSLIPEGQNASQKTQIRQITGATISSNGVINMLKDELSAINNLGSEAK